MVAGMFAGVSVLAVGMIVGNRDREMRAFLSGAVPTAILTPIVTAWLAGVVGRDADEPIEENKSVADDIAPAARAAGH